MLTMLRISIDKVEICTKVRPLIVSMDLRDAPLQFHHRPTAQGELAAAPWSGYARATSAAEQDVLGRRPSGGKLEREAEQ